VTPEELYELWAPKESIWSQWVLPVPFAQMTCIKSDAAAALSEYRFDWLPSRSSETAFVVDLPGQETIECGIALAARGYRPVPVIDGSPGPDLHGLILELMPSSTTERMRSTSVIDMRPLCRALCQRGQQLASLPLEPDSPPAFLLDSLRMGNTRNPDNRLFDNRWMTHPQDFPSGEFLQKCGIRKVVLIVNNSHLPLLDDLARVLSQWEKSAIALERVSLIPNGRPAAFTANKPPWFRDVWYSLLSRLGLRRRYWGKLLSYVPSGFGQG